MIDRNQLDIQAMLACAEGDMQAFSALVERHQQHLLNFFLRLGADYDAAEDLVQETFLRLYRWRQRYRPTARFVTFLFTLARHAWVDLLRKRGRTIRTEGELRPELHPGKEAPGAQHLVVSEALAQLSEKHRLVVVLHVYEGLNYAEIGAALNIPEGTVKSRMFHALRRLRELLGEDEA